MRRHLGWMVAVLVLGRGSRGEIVEATPSSDALAVVVGRVVDEHGSGVAGVSVEAYPCPFTLPDVMRPDVGVEWNDGWWAPVPTLTPIATVPTVADGSYRFDGLDPSTRLRLRVKPADGRASDALEVHPGTPFDSVGSLTVRKEEEVLVRVLGADGAPVAAELVVRAALRARGWKPSPGVVETARTDAEGRARLRGLTLGRLALDVWVAGVAVVRELALDVPVSEELVVRVGDPKGLAASGTVRDVGGSPVAGARVAIGTVAAAFDGHDVSTTCLATTDGQGRWSVKGITPGVLLGVGVHADGFLPLEDVHTGRPFDAKSAATFDFVLARGADVEGLIRDAGGVPIADAAVSVGDRHAVTGADGRWRVPIVGPGVHEIRVTAAEHYLPDSPAAEKDGDSGGVFVEVGVKGPVRAADLVLKRRVRVEGRVGDERHRPVRGAWVVASSDRAGRTSYEKGREVHVARTGGDGRYVLDGLTPGEEWVLVAHAEGLASDRFAPAHLRDPGRPVVADLRVHPVSRLVGRVVDLARRPAVRVELEVSGPERRIVTTDDRGEFVLHRLQAGAYVLTPTYEARRNQSKPTRPALIGRDGKDVHVDFPLDPPRPIDGIVVDEHDQPVAGASVRIVLETETDRRGVTWETWGPETTSGANGRFRLGNVAPGRHSIHPQKASGSTQVEAGDTNVRLIWFRDQLPDRANRADLFQARLGVGHLEVGGDPVPLEVHVVDPDGQRIDGATVTIRAQRKGAGDWFTGRVVGGVLRTTVPSKAESIDVEAKRARDASGAALPFTPGASRGLAPTVGVVTVKLGPPNTISGWLLNDDGTPRAGVRVFAGLQYERRPNPGTRSFAATDAEGRFQIVGLPGEWRLTADPGSAWKASTAIASPGVSKVLLRLSRANFIAGRVVDSSGVPIPGIGVGVGDVIGVSSLDGSFRVDDVESTSDVVAPVATSRASDQREMPTYGRVERSDVAAGTDDLELVLPPDSRITGTVVDPEGMTFRHTAVVRLDALPLDLAKPAVEQRLWSDHDFQFLDVTPGPYRLTVDMEGMAGNDRQLRRRSASIDIVAPVRGVRVTFDDAPAIHVRLTGADLTGFTASRIAIPSKDDARERRLDIAVAGNGSIDVPTDGDAPYSLYVFRPGDDRYGWIESIRRGDPPHEITLIEGTSIEGAIEGFAADESYLARWFVWARSGRGLVSPARIERDGRFSLRGLPPGEMWTIEGRATNPLPIRIARLEGVKSGSVGVKLTFPTR